MKILFWLEPHLELLRPGIMKTWLEWFERIAFELAEADANFDYRIVCLDSSSARARKSDLRDLQILLTQSELLANWQLSGNSFIDLEHDRVPYDICDHLSACLNSRLGEFKPDIVFLLCQQPWLRRSYSSALFVNIEVSWTSRVPFPFSWHLDIFGAGKGKVLAECVERILSTVHPSDCTVLVENVRLLASKHLYKPTAAVFVESLRHDYSTVTLFPIGAFDPSDGQTQFFSVLDKFLSEQINSTALILTQHPMWQLLNNEQIFYLVSKYSNVVDGSEYGSQNLLPWVDCVIGDFSAVATQALFFDTQVISVRRECHKFPIDSPLINPLVDLLANASSSQRDAILYWLLSHYTVTAAKMFDGAWLRRFLCRAIVAVRSGEPWDAYDRPIAMMVDWDASQWRYASTSAVVDSEEKLHINTGSASLSMKLRSDIDSLEHLFKDSLAKRDKRIKEQFVQLGAMRDQLTRAEAQLDLLKDLMLDARSVDRL